jgi:hypothetical protein
MLIPDYRRRGWNRARWTKPLFGIAGLLALATPFALARIPATQSLYDGRNASSALWIFGTIFVTWIGYSLLLRIAIWRWITAREAKQMASLMELSTSKTAWQDDPNQPQQQQKGQLVPAARLTPTQFEREVAWVFSQLMPVKPQLVGGAGDGGIDIKLYADTGTLVGIVQAKRFNERQALNPSFLRDLDSCKRRLGVRRAFLVTTARYSPAVCEQAKEMGIDLVDGPLFEKWRKQAHEKAQSTAR